MIKKLLISLLTWEARAVLVRTRPTVIAITGTVGKTSAKDTIARALTPFGRVRKSEKSFNSEIGVPFAILGATNPWRNPLKWFWVLLKGLFWNPRGDFLVLEVGTDRPGDIRAITAWLKPDVVVVTRLARVPVHVENFRSIGELIAEKGALVSAVRPEGVLILNADDADVRAYAALAPRTAKVISFGFNHAADVRAEEYQTLLAQTPFRPHQYALLAGIAAARALGKDTRQAASALTHWRGAPGRMQVLEGVSGSTLIDDSYNSSPVAAEEALSALAAYHTNSRRIAVLGDMLELGEFSRAEHERILARAVEVADLVFLVGPQFSICSRSWLNDTSKKVRVFPDARAAGEALAQELRAGDVALIKGSQGLRMERAVERVLHDPSHAPHLLVRQEREWKRKP